MRRLSAHVASIDIFGQGYVVRDDDGWQITPAGRDFLAGLEAITQDNLPQPDDAADVDEDSATRESGDLIVVGHRFRNRMRRSGLPVRKAAAFSSGRRSDT